MCLIVSRSRVADETGHRWGGGPSLVLVPPGLSAAGSGGGGGGVADAGAPDCRVAQRIVGVLLTSTSVEITPDLTPRLDYFRALKRDSAPKNTKFLCIMIGILMHC